MFFIDENCLVTSKEKPTSSLVPKIDHPVSIFPSSINWTIPVDKNPRNDVTALNEIGAGNSQSIAACNTIVLDKTTMAADRYTQPTIFSSSKMSIGVVGDRIDGIISVREETRMKLCI